MTKEEISKSYFDRVQIIELRYFSGKLLEHIKNPQNSYLIIVRLSKKGKAIIWDCTNEEEITIAPSCIKLYEFSKIPLKNKKYTEDKLKTIKKCKKL